MSGGWGSAAAWLLRAAPLVALLMIWAPQLAHFHVPTASLPDPLIQRARAEPADAVLAELERMPLGVPTRFKSEGELLAAAERLLKGTLDLPAFPSAPLSLPFAGEDLAKGGPALQFASLVGADMLLDAWRMTGRDQFFLAARDTIVAMAKYERSAWMPKGFLWNDHAIAARVPVITKFWRAYRSRPDFDPDVAREVLQFLGRSGELLVRPSHYTFRTNHGVMQNVGLMHICVAFPYLPGAGENCGVAIGRLRAQMGYYIDADGAVLEHSAGYHAMGVELLGMALRHMALLKQPVPPEWLAKYSKARAFYGEMRRPDGTLPMFGDTSSGESVVLATEPGAMGDIPEMYPLRTTRPAHAFTLLPVAGHAIWWRGLDQWPERGSLAQTVVTWASFPSNSHKLADDMSMILWSGGRTWVTSLGYWPYDVSGRGASEGSWDVTNAPHLAGESARSVRVAELLAYSGDPALTALDLRRRGPGGYVARRQILQFGSDLWLILDQVADQTPRKTVTTWTANPDLVLSRGSLRNEYRLAAPDGAALSAFFMGSPEPEVRILRGSRQPLAGWVVSDRVPMPAFAASLEQPSVGAWSAVLWMAEGRDRSGALAATPQMAQWKDAEHWTVIIPLKRGTVAIERAGAQLLARDNGRGNTMRAVLAAAPDTSAGRAAILASYEAARADSRRMPELWGYRVRISYLLAGALVGQELLWFLLRKRLALYRYRVRAALSAAWLLGGAWIAFVYLGG